MSLFANRYELQALLGQGTTARVHRAADRETGRVVALKELTTQEPDARLLFQQEYWSLRRLAHPGLVTAYDLGTHAGSDYFTMALVDGPELPVTATWTEAAVRDLLAAVAPTLAHLHARGFVHGDLKPANIRLDAGGAPRLLDLGFLQRVGRPGRRHGTLEYMAPEVLRGEPADPRSDLYALGVIAYQLLAGRPPFSASHPLGLVEAHLSAMPTPLQEARSDVTPALAELIAACLAKRPADRPATVAHLLAGLGLENAEADYLLFGSQLFGRTPERLAMHDQIRAQLAGEAPVLAIIGPAGCGKSRMLRDAAADGRVTVLATEGRGDQPYDLVAAIVAAAEPFLAKAGLARTDGAWQALRALAPAWGEPPPPLDPPNQENRLRNALIGLLATLAGEDGLLVLVDDWEIADQASRELLTRLIERPNDQRLAWVLGTREAAPVKAARLALPPLGAVVIHDILATALAQEPPADLVTLAVERAEGNPATLRDLLGHWRSQGALRREAGAWRLDPAVLATAAPFGGGAAAERVAALPPEARQLGRAAAVIGHEGTLAALAEVFGAPAFEARATLEEADLLERRGAIWRLVGTARDAFLAELAADEALVMWHRQAAGLYLGRTDLAGLTQHARHALAAALPGAETRALDAARANLAQGALSTALELLVRVGEHPLPDAEAREAARLRGDVDRMQGRTQEAQGHYGVAIALARQLDDRQALCRELVSAGRVAIMLTEKDRARALLGEALALARAIGERPQEARCLMTLGRLDFFAGQRAAAREAYEAARTIAREAGARGLEADALGFLGVMADPGDPAGRALLQAAVAMHRELQNPLGTIDALINLGDRRHASGDLTGAAEAFGEALTLCRQIGSRNEEAFVRLNQAQTDLDRGEPAAAREAAERAHALAADLGLRYPEGLALVLGGLAALELGNYPAARRLVADGLRRGVETGNRYLETAAQLAAAQLHLTLGEADEASEAIQQVLEAKAEADDAAGLAAARWLQGRLLTLTGGHAEALRMLAAAREGALACEATLTAARAEAAEACLALRTGDHGEAARAAASAFRRASALGARAVAAEASWVLAEADRLAGRAEEAVPRFEAVRRYGAEAAVPLAEALGLLGLARTSSEGGVGAWRLRAGSLLRELALRAGGEGFDAWPERVPDPGRADSNDAPPAGLAEAIAIVADVRQATSLDDLLARILARLVPLTHASLGALLAYNGLRLEACATEGLAEAGVHELPLVDQVHWDAMPVFEEERWALPVVHDGEVLAVIYLEGTALAGRPLMPYLTEAVGLAVGQFIELRSIQARVECLGFSESLARMAVGGMAPRDVLTQGLVAALVITGADRGFVLRVETGVPAITLGVDREGRPLPADTPVSRSVCQWVAESGEPVRVLDAQQVEAWQKQQSILALDLRTIVAVPVRDDGQIVGLLYVDSASVVSRLGAREQALLEAAAEVLAPLLARA